MCDVIMHGLGGGLACIAMQVVIFTVRRRRRARPRWPLLYTILLGFEQRLDVCDRFFRADVIVVLRRRGSG